MSYLSTSENVGFSGISQSISDASCATQYKMAVEGVSSCSDVNMFLHDNPADEQTYITQFNDNFYTKFKIDPNELYTFHDSDVIANEITVSHTEDIHIFDGETKNRLIESANGDLDLVNTYTNGDIKEEKKELILNGHYAASIPTTIKSQAAKDIKTSHTKVSKIKSQIKEPAHKDSLTVHRSSTHSPNVQSTVPSPCAKSSINIVNTKNLKPQAAATKQLANETFLDVFKREHGLVLNTSSALIENALNTIKVPTSPPKKAASGKTSAPTKVKRGRGPAVHEALQRIPSQRRAIPMPCKSWHAPGDVLFNCGPLDDKQPQFRQLESSSSDDDNIPDFEAGWGSVCVEESAAETRGARLALRRAALRRHVARAHTTLRLAKDHRDDRSLVNLIKKQFVGKSPSVLSQTVNHLLAMRGMPAVLSSQDRRQLRESGWSGGESGAGESGICAEENCTERAAPCARYCLSHVTLAGEQRLYAACAAVFAGGARCRHPLLPLHDHTPLCAEHAWKRDNYDKFIRDTRPRKTVRIRVTGGVRRPRRRRRAPTRPRPPAPPPSAEHSLSEINVCSNSSTYDSSEDAALGTLSDNEYVGTNSNELEVEVGHVPPDDILDPSVLSQIPDVAFTEFFNQAEGGASFTESSELAAALEAVLEERVLDERTLDNIVDVFTHNHHENDQHHHHHQHPHLVKNKIQVAALIPTEMQSSAPS